MDKLTIVELAVEKWREELADGKINKVAISVMKLCPFLLDSYGLEVTDVISKKDFEAIYKESFN